MASRIELPQRQSQVDRIKREKMLLHERQAGCQGQQEHDSAQSESCYPRMDPETDRSQPLSNPSHGVPPATEAALFCSSGVFCVNGF